MVSNIDIVACMQKIVALYSRIDPRIVLLEYRIAKCDINLPQGRKKVLVMHPPAEVRDDGFLW